MKLINQAKGFSLDSAKSRVEEKLQNLDSEYEKYKEVKNCDFQGCYANLSPVEKAAWNAKFDEENERK